jgi:Spy/CpxP family protein refolding chaperone
MRSLNRFASGFALALLVSLPAFAQDRGPVEPAARPAASPAGAFIARDPLADFTHCLRILDLTEAQKTAIREFIGGEKPTLQSLHEALRTDRQTLEADASATQPERCKVGDDFLKVVSDREAIRAEIGKIRAFVESQLTPEQKARFEGCLRGPGSSTASGTTP